MEPTARETPMGRTLRAPGCRTSPLAAAIAGLVVLVLDALALEVAARERRTLRMAGLHVRDVPFVVRHTHDAPHDHGGASEGLANPREGHCRPDPFEVRASRAAPMFRSKSLKIRVYSSVQESGRTNPWSSTGYTAISQFSFPSSMSRCARRTTSWKCTFTSTMPCAMSNGSSSPCAK